MNNKSERAFFAITSTKKTFRAEYKSKLVKAFRVVINAINLRDLSDIDSDEELGCVAIPQRDNEKKIGEQLKNLKAPPVKLYVCFCVCIIIETKFCLFSGSKTILLL